MLPTVFLCVIFLSSLPLKTISKTDYFNWQCSTLLFRSLGITQVLGYKPDINTYLNIYQGNSYNLRPTVYRSFWLHRFHGSVVKTVFDWNQVPGIVLPDEEAIRELENN
jgi:hypothetical protein